MRKEEIKVLQYKLKKVLNRSLSVDGDYGRSTTSAVKQFQGMYSLTIDGVAGRKTISKLNSIYTAMFQANSDLLHFGKKRFAVFVDAGHGGINESGLYVTSGKRAYHKGAGELHERGHYYEGFENRLHAEAFIEACTAKGIMCIRIYHPYKDTPLSERTEIVRSWLRRGYYGYLHSFHSNAISSSNSTQKLEATRGFMVFSSRGNSFSDLIADKHFKHVKEETKGDWTYREQRGKDGDVDFEVNFQIMRETDLREFPYFGSILDEWGFHTSSKDTEFIVNPERRKQRVEACVRTAVWVKNKFDSVDNILKKENS